jgi:putative membrane protein
MATFMTPAGEAALQAAIEAIERQSSAEVVISVRPRLRRWLIPHIAVGAVCATAMLAFLLFSEAFEFELWLIALAPLLAALIGAFVVEAAAPIERALMPRRVRDALVREAARASFYELGVSRTAGRTGVLVFAAVRERGVVLIGDLEVVARIGDGLAGHEAALGEALASGSEALAGAITKLAGPFGAALPRAAADVNELGDVVHLARPRRGLRGVKR